MHVELSSLLVNMKPESQGAVAVVLRTVIWNWIETFTEEFIDVVLSSRRRLDGQPERVFDMLYQLIEPGNRRMLWPTLAVLMAVSPERLATAEAAMNGNLKYGRKVCLCDNESKLSPKQLGCAVQQLFRATTTSLDNAFETWGNRYNVLQ
jgi:hypothetical protein